MRQARLVATLLGLALATVPAQYARAAATSASASAAAHATPAGWPHSSMINGSTVTIYQPQAISWPEQKTLTARVAVELKPAGTTKPILGTLTLSFATATDGEWVKLSEPRLVSSHFPSLDTAQAAALEAKIRTALATRALPRVSLANLRISLGQKPAVPSVALDNNPPVIFISATPASLVVFDGSPVLAPTGASGLSFAVNTNWSVFFTHNTWYLLNNGLWLTATKATGPYHPVQSLPAAFDALPNNASFAEVRKSIPPQRKSNQGAPQIFVSTKPAAIVVTSGPPEFVPVPGIGLQTVKNTTSTLFFDPKLGQFYLLLSGRWFAAPSLAGPWSFASNDLPADFSLIPPAAPQGVVLASVPGTTAAEQAVLEASIPHTATLNRTSATFSVTYTGIPEFRPISGTSVAYALNTEAIVLRIADRYYACTNGAWFTATAPNGPWLLADSLPPAIATIPPSSPLYPVTYVQVYGTSPTSVTYGYTAGYLMGFVSAGLLVYGTGYAYPPVVVPGRVPGYYPYPYTYAGNVWYNSATGAWARGGSIYGPYYGATGGRAYNPTTGAWAQGAAVYGPYGGAGAWSRYNPSTGTYAHGSAVWGGGSGSANASAYNPRTGVAASTNQNVNPYERWGSSTVSGPNKTINTASGANAHGSAGGFSSSTGAKGAGYHGANGNHGAVGQGSGGNVYAGRDGNVYQHSDGGWSKWNNGGWQPVQPPAKPPGTQESLGQSPANGRTRSNGAGGQLTTQNWQQLQQDRLGRTAGELAGRSNGAFSGERGRFEQNQLGATHGGGRFGGSHRR